MFKDATNAASLKEIEDALIVVCLDELSPSTPTDKAKALLHRDGRQRWWDKFQLVVFPDGGAGAILEHTPVDGHTSLRVWVEYFTALRSRKPVVDGSGKVEVQPLNWNVGDQLRSGSCIAPCHISTMPL